MKIIEKIEIKHFRSFDGGVGQEKVVMKEPKKKEMTRKKMFAKKIYG